MPSDDKCTKRRRGGYHREASIRVRQTDGRRGDASTLFRSRPRRPPAGDPRANRTDWAIRLYGSWRFMRCSNQASSRAPRTWIDIGLSMQRQAPTTTASAIVEMNERCGVFTSGETADHLLNALGWAPCEDLRDCTLLEPSVGDGAILVEAARRLVTSFRKRGGELACDELRPRIRGFEFHPATALQARGNLEEMLIGEGFSDDSVRVLSSAWVVEKDFLLHPPGDATHVAANPPYLRWSKLPAPLAGAYRRAVRPLAQRGDVSVAFLDRMREWAWPDGEIVALVSDRWMYAKYGEPFVADCAKGGWHVDVLQECAANPFVRRVGVSAVIVRMSRRKPAGDRLVDAGRHEARKQRQKLIERHGSLSDAGCEVRVGPALGCGATFVVDEAEAGRLEPTLVRDYLDRTWLTSPGCAGSSLKLIAPYDAEGELIDPMEYPRFRQWIASHKEKLSARSQVRRGMQWWRTIDAIGPIWQEAPKLLLPELTRVPRVEADFSTSVPAHSIYAIWPGSWPVAVLARVLNAGLLRLTASAEAPTLKNGWYRFYKRFIVRTPLPAWNALSEADQAALSSGSEADFSRCYRALFDLEAETAHLEFGDSPASYSPSGEVSAGTAGIGHETCGPDDAPLLS